MDRHYDELVKSGVSPAEARRQVRLEFGDLELAKDECRDVRPFHWVAHLVRDAALGFRSLRREPRFAASVIAVLALGIGASVSMFSVLDAIVLRPLPYARPAELVALSTHHIARNQWDGTSFPTFVDWRTQAASFAGMTCYRRTQSSQATLQSGGEPVRVQEGVVDAAFFDVLGAAPLLGRTFSRDEFDRGERVVVISEGLWHERFGGLASALGQTIAIDGANHVVIGVMPQRFQLPTADTRLWRPLSVLGSWLTAVAGERDGDGFEVIGRLRPGVGMTEARAEMAAVAARLREAHAISRQLDAQLVPLFDHVVDARTHRGVWLGFASVLLLLAIACANVGGLLAARTTRRRNELALRSALGAARSRLVGQLLAETVSLWAVAASIGLMLAEGTVRVLLAYGPRTLPRMDQVGLDGRALVVAFAGGLVVMLVAGTLPAFLAVKSDAGISAGARSTTHRRTLRLQQLLVVGQIACAVFLLVAAVALARSFLRAQGEDAGFAPDNVLVVRIERSTVPGFFVEARDRIGSLPGVTAVGGIKQFFLRRNPDQRVIVEGRPASSAGLAPRLTVDAVTPGYFRSMGIDVIEGRDFDDADLTPGTDASIVNETMARRLWPGESPLGKRWAGGEAPPRNGRWNTVVGVVKDLRREGLDVPPIAAAFVPDMFSGNFDMTIRSSVAGPGLIPAVRARIRALDPALPVSEIGWARASLSTRLAGRRFQAQVLIAFTAIALLLAAVGIYGSLAYQVSSRTRDIGIRSALGQARWPIVRPIVGQGLRLALVGSVLGVAAAALASRALQGLLYETSALSAGGAAGAVCAMLLVSVAAAWGPAWRAATISPILALREE